MLKRRRPVSVRFLFCLLLPASLRQGQGSFVFLQKTAARFRNAQFWRRRGRARERRRERGRERSRERGRERRLERGRERSRERGRERSRERGRERRLERVRERSRERGRERVDMSVYVSVDVKPDVDKICFLLVLKDCHAKEILFDANHNKSGNSLTTIFEANVKHRNCSFHIMM